jgi:hypothetical protein
MGKYKNKTKGDDKMRRQALSLLLISILLIMSCGNDISIIDRRTPYQPIKEWKVIDRAEINLSLLQGLTVTDSTTVVYVSAIANQFTINTGSLSTTESIDTNTINLGSISTSSLKVNDLNQCGTGTEKCTSAVIRIYTTPVSGHPGVTGFVNKTNNYGVPIKAGKTSANTVVGLTVSNAAVVDSYTIPAGDRKLTAGDFGSTTYLLEVDFSNAGSGNYEAILVIELAVGL